MEEQVVDTEDIFGSLSVSKILVAAIETLGEIAIPTSVFLNAATEDKELQVDYNSDNQIFTFKIKANNGAELDNDQLITDFE